MQTIEFKNKKWVIDLDWEILPGDSTVKQESKDVAAKTACSYGLIVEYDGQFAIGLAKKNSKVPSAAFYLALANQEARLESGDSDPYPDWIVIEEMGDDKYWMSVITRGIPSPQYDKVLDITTVKEKITELLINDTYHIFSPCGEIKSIFEGIKFIEDKNLNELTEAVYSKTKFTKLRGIPNNVAYGAVALLVVMGVYFAVDGFLDSYAMKQRAAEAQKRQQDEEKMAEAQYQEKVKIYNKQIEDLKHKEEEQIIMGLAGTPSKMLNAWYEAIGGIESGTHGWKMNKIDCEFVPGVTPQPNSSSCSIKFARTGLTTNRMLLQDYPDAEISGDLATVTRKVIVDESIFEKPDHKVLDGLPSAKNWGFDMLSQLQLLKIANIDFEIKKTTDITFIPPVKPVNPKSMVASGGKAEAVVPVSIGLGSGELVIKSDNFDLLREVADNVDFKAVGVKKISFTLGELGSIKWDATLSYYVNTVNGVIDASNSSLLSNDSLAKPKPDKPIWQTMDANSKQN